MEVNKEELQRKMQEGKNVGKAAKTEEAAPVVNTAGAAQETSEFTANAENADPTMPVKKNGMVSRAEKPLRRETIKIDEKDVVVEIYRVYEKNGELVEMPYEVGTGTKLNKDGREEIAALNREALTKINEHLASMKQTHGPRMKIMEFLRKFTFIVGLATPNNVAPELIVTLDREKNPLIDQKRYKSQIREKSAGGVRAWLLCVPVRAYEFMTEGVAMDGELINEIISETTPSMKVVAISKDDFPMALLSVFGGAIPVMEELFDNNTSPYASVKEIPSISGMASGKELIYYALDNKKVGINIKQPQQDASESPETYAKRVKAWTESQERGQRLRAGGLRLEEKASIIRIRSNARTSMISHSNFIPFRTFTTTPVGVVVAPQQARKMCSVYLHKLEDASVKLASAENGKVNIVGGKVESSIYFPVDQAQQGKIEPIKRYFKNRGDDGKLVKASYVPQQIILKEIVRTEKGSERPLNRSVSIGEAGYKSSQYDMVKGLFDTHMNKLAPAMKCAFIQPDELVAASKKARTSTVATKISTTAVDKSLLDAQLMMLSLSVGDGAAVIDVANTAQNIDAVKASRTVTVATKKRLTPEMRANLENALKAKA